MQETYTQGKTDEGIHYRIVGNVQGVGFRAFVKELADSLGIKGYARNEIDRSVTVFALGTQETLDKLQLAIKNGPDAADVLMATELTSRIVEAEPQEFKIL